MENYHNITHTQTQHNDRHIHIHNNNYIYYHIESENYNPFCDTLNISLYISYLIFYPLHLRSQQKHKYRSFCGSLRFYYVFSIFTTTNIYERTEPTVR